MEKASRVGIVIQKLGESSAYSGQSFDDSLPFRQALAESIVEVLFPEPEPGTTDDKLRPGQTVKEALDRCIEIAEDRIQDCLVQVPNRDMRPIIKVFDRAVGYMHNAQMWYARGRHMQEGSFNPSDVDRWIADGKDVQETVAERDRAAGKES